MYVFAVASKGLCSQCMSGDVKDPTKHGVKELDERENGGK